MPPVEKLCTLRSLPNASQVQWQLCSDWSELTCVNPQDFSPLSSPVIFLSSVVVLWQTLWYPLLQMSSLALGQTLKHTHMPIYGALFQHSSFISHTVLQKLQSRRPPLSLISISSAQWDGCALPVIPSWQQPESRRDHMVSLPCFLSLRIRVLYCLLSNVWNSCFTYFAHLSTGYSRRASPITHTHPFMTRSRNNTGAQVHIYSPELSCFVNNSKCVCSQTCLHWTDLLL